MNELDTRLEKIERKLDEVWGDPRVLGGARSSGDEIDLRELFEILWRGKLLIFVLTAFFTVASVFYALSLPNVYKSQALLAPADENSGGGLTGLVGQFGGLASLAGVNIGAGGNDKTVLALEVMKSREFISGVIHKYDLLVPLMASNGWDRNSSSLIIDPDVFDVESGSWVRDFKAPRTAKPSMQEALDVFGDIYKVEQDKKTKFVSISVEFYSPNMAKRWVDILVKEINDEIKRRDVREAKKSVKYLKEQLNRTSLAQMKTVFFELIEEQTKTIMFAEVREEYVFKTVDKAIVPELKSSPARAIIVVLGAILGCFISLLVLILLSIFKPR